MERTLERKFYSTIKTNIIVSVGVLPTTVNNNIFPICALQFQGETCSIVIVASDNLAFWHNRTIAFYTYITQRPLGFLRANMDSRRVARRQQPLRLTLKRTIYSADLKSCRIRGVLRGSRIL